jgi:hypothetical protein
VRKFNLVIVSHASASVQVSLSDARLTEIAVEFEKSVDELTVEDLRDTLEESFDPPKICDQCSGRGRTYSLEISDEWELALDKNSDLDDVIVEVTEDEDVPRPDGWGW